MKVQIGFGKPESSRKTWERQIKGRTFVFSKIREKQDVFLYECKRKGINGDSATSFYSDRDIPIDDVEKLRQFDHFIDH